MADPVAVPDDVEGAGDDDVMMSGGGAENADGMAITEEESGLPGDVEEAPKRINFLEYATFPRTRDTCTLPFPMQVNT